MTRISGIAMLTACVLASTSAADIAGDYFGQSFSARAGRSRISFKRKLKAPLSEADAWEDIFASIHDGDVFNVDIDMPTGELFMSTQYNWVVSGQFVVGKTFRAGYDNGTCKIKASLKFGQTPPEDKGKFYVKCVAPITIATIDYVRITLTTAAAYDVCFENGGARSAIVVRDGSDGKRVKMKAAPSDACEVP